MQSENQILRDLHEQYVPVGEVETFTTETVTIRGPFNPGAALTLRPGARVYILDEDAAIELTGRGTEVDV